jgi:hypothetical protein
MHGPMNVKLFYIIKGITNLLVLANKLMQPTD